MTLTKPNFHIHWREPMGDRTTPNLALRAQIQNVIEMSQKHETFSFGYLQSTISATKNFNMDSVGEPYTMQAWTQLPSSNNFDTWMPEINTRINHRNNYGQ